MNQPAYVATFDSAELARVTANALAFMPARSRVDVCRITMGTKDIAITASDTYTIGTDWLDVDGNGFASVEVHRDDLKSLDKAARADKKGIGRLVFYPGDTLVFEPTDGESVALKDRTDDEKPVMLDTYQSVTTESFWNLCDDLMERLEAREIEDWPKRLCFDPSLLTRFNKIRVPKDHEPIADFLCQGETAPVLIKIGPRFVGAIMPIKREIAEANPEIGKEGTWDEEVA